MCMNRCIKACWVNCDHERALQGQRLGGGEQTTAGPNTEALQSSQFAGARSEERPVILQPRGTGTHTVLHLEVLNSNL